MYGVVLWADRRRKKAVIWCEDQGDLAFLTPGEDAFAHTDFAHGDMIAFDLDCEGPFRRARNARIIDSEAYPSLARSLKTIIERQPAVIGGDVPPPDCDPVMSNVVPFASRGAAQTSDRLRRTAP